MMKRKLRGFSLAELLISLLIISIALSAAIPTLTRKSSASREFIWRWSNENNSAYFGVGSNQSAIIGAETIPLKTSSLESILSDDEVNIGDVKFSNNGDKLLLVKKTVYLGAGNTNPSDFANSHISFYNAANGASATTAAIRYAGRIASDKHNLAFGIGTLQSLDNGLTGENTAIGHYTLLRTTTGVQNTALGEKALSFNTIGNGNTAAGFKSLFSAGNSGETSYNSALGDAALVNLTEGSYNTAIGALALAKNKSGKDNLGLGYASLQGVSGSNNIGIGTDACSLLQSGDNNICIGNRTMLFSKDSKVLTSDNYGLSIGSSSDSKTDTGSPLIQGHMKKTGTAEKELIINAKDIEFRPHNSGAAIFKVYALANDSSVSPGAGYGTGGNGYTGQFFFSLRKLYGDSTTLSFTGTQDDVVIASYNEDAPVATMKTQGLKNISFNNILNFKFPNAKTAAADKNTVGIYTGNSASGSTTSGGSNYILNLNGRIKIEDNNDTPTINLTKNDGFMLSTGTGGSSIKLKKDSTEVLLKDNSSNNFIYTNLKDQFSVSLDNGNFQIRSQDGGNLVAPNYFITKSQVIFKALESVTIPGQQGGKLSNDLGKNFTGIWKTIDDLRKQLGSMAGYSDARLKDITGDNIAGLKEINALEVKNFTFKNDKEKTPHVGVIAQQLQKIFPDAVSEDENGYLKIRQEDIFYAMVNSIKELFAKIQDLTAKVTGLDKRITELEKQNAQLKKQNEEFEKRLSKLEKAVK